ncbi:MAG: ornithine decarboxylase, partial [Flavobacteriales bacterium]
MKKPQSIKTRQHFNAARLRSFTWNKLKMEAIALDEGRGKSSIVQEALNELLTIEPYWAFPGIERIHSLLELVDTKQWHTLQVAVAHIVRDLVSGSFRNDPLYNEDSLSGPEEQDKEHDRHKQNYFEVLFVDEIDEEEEHALKYKLRKCRDQSDQFTYDVIVVRTVQDALIALLFNHNIQACVVRYGVPFPSTSALGILRPFLRAFDALDLSTINKSDLGPKLGSIMRDFRPEVDRYYVTDTPINGLLESTLKNFRRIFYRSEDLQEMHLTILRGIRERYETPFFTALKEYSKRPMGVFHAMPISRGNSVFKSRWIKDFGEFYGRNLFLAETSATTGGLDSLLQPTGPLKKAQELARDAFGSQHTFFATNGTSSSNKIVVQALVEPGDVVLIDRDCHKSHHYGMVLSGSYPVYLHSYPLPKYSMYGAVPLEHIREKLITLQNAGRMDKVKMVLLTNSTFDGVVYN